MNSVRQTLLDEVAEAISAVRIDHPLRVAVDGRTAAGKTTFADELALISGIKVETSSARPSTAFTDCERSDTDRAAIRRSATTKTRAISRR
jgi:hypothetical protein